jgi:hypothetical protein
VYYQALFNVPVNTYSSSYSMLNTGSNYKPDLTDSLTNSGTGRNYGVELTVEKFFSKGYYGLFTSSIYNSKYTASDGKERNTAYNGKYVFNFLVGKEIKVGTGNRNALTIDLKVTNAGGRYYTPTDTQRPPTPGFSDTYAYSSRYSSYLRIDAKVGYTLNSRSKKLSQSLSLDIQNITNHDNIYSYNYDDKTNTIKATYQLGFFPNFIYRVQF